MQKFLIRHNDRAELLIKSFIVIFSFTFKSISRTSILTQQIYVIMLLLREYLHSTNYPHFIGRHVL